MFLDNGKQDVRKLRRSETYLVNMIIFRSYGAWTDL